MPAFIIEPGNNQARLLVLRPVQTDRMDRKAHRSAAWEQSDERDQEWELADPWGIDEAPAAARAVTRRMGHVVMLLRIWVNDAAPRETTRLLVDQLVAALRRTDASMVWSSVEDTDVREELLAAGFVPLPGELG